MFGYYGNGGPAIRATLNFPEGVAFDPNGNLYIADGDNGRIRKVDTNGIITTVAGNGSQKYAGDGGAATNASLNYPYGVVFDSVGNWYIADWGNNCIRKVDTNGIITTVAGGGSGGDGGAATNANLIEPTCVALDAAGNLYIADAANNRIRKVAFAGNPTLSLADVSTNNAGNYIVVITSPYGSVTSAVATLTVQAPPQIVTGDGSFGFVGSQFGFNVSAGAGLTIVVDGSIDLVNWTPFCTNTVGSSPFYFCDPCWTNSPWRFYRARVR